MQGRLCDECNEKVVLVSCLFCKKEFCEDCVEVPGFLEGIKDVVCVDCSEALLRKAIIEKKKSLSI